MVNKVIKGFRGVKVVKLYKVLKVFKGSEVGIKGERHFIIVAIGLTAFVSRK